MIKKITIVTPTYNREHTLRRCYKSLCNQADKDFLWLVIDDGSTDKTEKLIHDFQKENKIEIKYVKKENGGKASALNLSLDILETEYCVCLDSDEYFSDNAIEIALNYLNKENKNESVCGIIALRRDEYGGVLGGKEIPEKVDYIKFVDINDKYNIVSEVICFYKTKILKQFRFPEFENEKFVSPAYIQYEITKDYKFKVFREPIIFCKYLEDGLTKNKKNVIKKNPKGYLAVKEQSFRYSKNWIKIIKHGIMYGTVSILDKDKNFMKKSPHKILSFILYPVSYIVYLKKFREKTTNE